MANLLPRIVLVTRPTDYASLLAAHGTRDQAKFHLESRGQRLEEIEGRHTRFQQAMTAVQASIPLRWRRVRIDRADLPNFLFEPEDLIVALGQDGLVANLAKHLEGQRVIGLNPEPDRFEGVLVPHPPEALPDLLNDVSAGRARILARRMAEARLDDGQVLRALNELFLGHGTHQSARYRLRLEEREERQSSSGLIVATGTGSTGWARSISRERQGSPVLPRPDEPRLAFFVREAWPSRWTGIGLTEGCLDAVHQLEVVSEMNDGGVIFGDGLEEDRLAFPWGTRAVLGLSEASLMCVVG